MDMNKEDEVALEESISDWKDKAKGKNVGRSCPLCELGKIRDDTDADEKYYFRYCINCIIKKHTGVPNCQNTPYHDRSNLDYYQHEIEFLESLRPEKKVKEIIEIGDKVSVRDKSWAVQLYGEVIKDIDLSRDISQNIYTVVIIGQILPEGDTRKGQYGNDTILYHLDSRSYIFTRMKYLKLVELKHCSECGKAK